MPPGCAAGPTFARVRHCALAGVQHRSVASSRMPPNRASARFARQRSEAGWRYGPGPSSKATRHVPPRRPSSSGSARKPGRASPSPRKSATQLSRGPRKTKPRESPRPSSARAAQRRRRRRRSSRPGPRPRPASALPTKLAARPSRRPRKPISALRPPKHGPRTHAPTPRGPREDAAQRLAEVTTAHDAELERLRADAARERDELRSALDSRAQILEETRGELRARAERAERDLDAVRAELARIRYAGDAEYSAVSWLIHRTGITRGAAVGHAAWAGRTRTHPAVVAALAAGQVSESAGRLICLWTGRLPEKFREESGEVLLAAAAAGLGVAELAALFAQMYERARSELPDQEPGFRGPRPEAGDDVRRRGGAARGPDAGVRGGGRAGAGRAGRPGREGGRPDEGPAVSRRAGRGDAVAVILRHA